MIRKKQQEELLLESKTFFEAHKKEIGASLRTGERVVRIEFPKIAQLSPKLSEKILLEPIETIELFETALEETYSEFVKKPKIRLLDLPKEGCYTKIRDIRAKHLDQMISIEGIIKQASEVRPQVVNAKFECPSCGAILTVLQMDNKFREPNKCSCQWRGNFKILSKDMIDAQLLVIEESLDTLEGGAQPRKIKVFLKEDLVDPKMESRTTPGSKVKIYGVLKEVPKPTKTGIETTFDIAVEANNAIPSEESFEELNISEEEEKQILELAADPSVYKRLSQSIAPSIYGFEKIKEAVLLQLFSGVKKIKSDGGKTRGDIHVLLVGDPGVAKSVMLKFTSVLSQRGRYVSGKAATAAGLTAAVVKDEFMKAWALEGGAMVLANKGVLCIDEIEKMEEHDRSTMHEAMEQQTITISKANIHATLGAETSVLAAGNPKLGRFDPHTPIPLQINITPALLSRFDLMFILKDHPNKARDEAIATHVLEEHKQGVIRDVIEPKLLKKYIAYAKQKFKPKLTDEVIEEIKDFYVRLRGQTTNSESEIRAIPITARQLEGIVRLAEAHAKMRLSNEVGRDDARQAIELMKYSLRQVGFDEETQSFDIDRITTGIPHSKRSKFLLMRETILQLESKFGKLIPLEELKKELGERVNENEFNDGLIELRKSGDIFHPKQGYVSRATSR